MNFVKKSPILIASIYFLLGTLWINVTDRLLPHIARTPQKMADLAIYKEWLFVAITSLLLYWLIRMYGGKLLAFRDEAAEKMRQSEARLKSIIDNLPFDFWVSDRDGRYVMQNSISVKNWGVCDGRNLDEIGLPEDISTRWKLNHQNALNGEVVACESEYDINGVHSYRYDVVGPVRDKDTVWGSTAVSIDITQLKLAENALRESETRYRLLFKDAILGIFQFSPEGRILDLNPAFARMFGYHTPAELKMWVKNAADLYADPSRRAEVVRMVMESKGSVKIENEYRRRDGSVFTGNLFVWLVRDGAGRTIWFEGFIEDITDRKLAEEEKKRLETQLFQAQKMEAVGQLAGGVAHDFNNILTAIKGYAYLLKSIIQDGRSQHYIDQLDRAADKAASLTNSLLAFSRKRVVCLKPIGLNEAIVRSQKLLSRLIDEDIEIRTFLSGGGLTILGDESHIDQVMINLVTNARDAMPNGGILFISTDRFEMGREFIDTHRFGRIGEYALLKVSDTGAGMDDKTREHVFEPFFTTKDVDKGTGLGLSIVYGIVKQHEGFIDIESEPGKGTTFSIYFPLIGDKKNEEADRQVEPAPARGVETILIGEDDPNVRELTRTLLEEFGYVVMEATDGTDAVAKFLSNKDRIQLVVLDVIMPKKNGKDAYEEMKKIKPDIKTIFLSGYTSDILTSKGILQEGLNFVMKPVSPTDLLNKVREVLG